MSCWSTLQIDPTDDKKRIKRAYAKLLKVTRPDEDMNAFQTLHSAYKEALSGDYFYEDDADGFWDDEAVGIPVEPLESVTESDDVVHLYAGDQHITEGEELDIVYAYTPEYEGVAVDNRDSDVLIDRKISYLKTKILRIFKNDQLVSNVEAWMFIEDNTILDDLEIKQEISDYLFSKLVEYQLRSDHGVKYDNSISNDVLAYLNNYFHWTEAEYVLEASFSELEIESVFKYIQKPIDEGKGNWIDKKEVIREADVGSYSMRFYANLIDMILFVVVGVILTAIVEVQFQLETGGDGIYFTIVMYAVIVSIMESSFIQASPGKWLMRLQVVNTEREKVTFLQALLRILICGVMMIYPIIIANVIGTLILFKKRKLVHDHLTSTRVINRD